jgi:2-polyprenyl-3-methyl-5-hydroxy-6-metoxy-1,4-benzoquinol methylase
MAFSAMSDAFQFVADRTGMTILCCDACGSQRINVILNDLSHNYENDGIPTMWRYKLLECQDCGLGFINPMPRWSLLQTFYDEHYGNYDITTTSPEAEAKSLKYQIARARFAGISPTRLRITTKATLGMIAEWITGRTVSHTLGIPLQLPKDAHVFDMGYGSGSWLLTMSMLGYENLHGYDIDANSKNAYPLRAAGMKISNGIFHENEYAPSAFDCIRLSHVFEHLLDPVRVLEKCHTMLKPDGFLVMDLPCKNSWSMKLSLKESPALQLPKHIYHHTQSSVRLMIEAAGLIPISIQAYSVAGQLGGTVNSILLEKRRKTIPLSLFELLAPMYRVFGKVTGKGDFITAWAKR